MNTGLLVFQLSNGLGFGTSPRIGNLIGAAKPRQARIAAKMAILASSFIGVLGTLFLVFCGDWWTLVYTSDPDVIRETAKLIPVLCTLIVGDGLNAVLSAILRGLGRQKVGANIYLFAFYVCAVPIGLYLGYVLNMQAVGLWWGICSGVILTCLLQIYYIFKKVDWNDEVRLCLIRLQNDSQPALIDAEDNILK
ncbi:ethionine resistance protein [Coemansia erecta]|nr:ethionine resistance protein [Coemansia erecta]